MYYGWISVYVALLTTDHPYEKPASGVAEQVRCRQVAVYDVVAVHFPLLHDD